MSSSNSASGKPELRRPSTSIYSRTEAPVRKAGPGLADLSPPSYLIGPEPDRAPISSKRFSRRPGPSVMPAMKPGAVAYRCLVRPTTVHPSNYNRKMFQKRHRYRQTPRRDGAAARKADRCRRGHVFFAFVGLRPAPPNMTLGTKLFLIRGVEFLDAPRATHPDRTGRRPSSERPLPLPPGPPGPLRLAVGPPRPAGTPPRHAAPAGPPAPAPLSPVPPALDGLAVPRLAAQRPSPPPGAVPAPVLPPPPLPWPGPRLRPTRSGRPPPAAPMARGPRAPPRRRLRLPARPRPGPRTSPRALVAARLDGPARPRGPLGVPSPRPAPPPPLPPPLPWPRWRSDSRPPPCQRAPAAPLPASARPPPDDPAAAALPRPPRRAASPGSRWCPPPPAPTPLSACRTAAAAPSLARAAGRPRQPPLRPRSFRVFRFPPTCLVFLPVPRGSLCRLGSLPPPPPPKLYQRLRPIGTPGVGGFQKL